jgi:hypothetical protein
VVAASRIRRCRDDEREQIYAIVNAAAERYRGVIPAGGMGRTCCAGSWTRRSRRRARAYPSRPRRLDPRLRAHARDAARRRNPDRPSHHQPARRRHQAQPATPPPGNVNRTLGQRGVGNGASPTIEVTNATTPTKPRPVKHQPRPIRQASADTAHRLLLTLLTDYS